MVVVNDTTPTNTPHHSKAETVITPNFCHRLVPGNRYLRFVNRSTSFSWCCCCHGYYFELTILVHFLRLPLFY